MSEQILNKIDITISGRKYPIKVNEEEELEVRNIEKKLNQQVHEFQLKYPNKDKLDCVIMTMLTLAFENSRSSKLPLTMWMYRSSIISTVCWIKQSLNFHYFIPVACTQFQKWNSEIISITS